MFGDIFWSIFAWVFGVLFFFSGIYGLFNPIYSENNTLISIAASVLGFFLVYKWFKERKQNK